MILGCCTSEIRGLLDVSNLELTFYLWLGNLYFTTFGCTLQVRGMLVEARQGVHSLLTGRLADLHAIAVSVLAVLGVCGSVSTTSRSLQHLFSA